MAIESGTSIKDLNSAFPLAGDFISEGDDHLRLIKKVLQAQFPGTLGFGYDTPILAKESDLNFLTDVTSNVQDQLDFLRDNLTAPPGTVMTFYNETTPLQWTQILIVDNRMLRVVTDGGGTDGGDDDPTSFSATHSHTTGSIAINTSQMPNHDHSSNVIVRHLPGGDNNDQAINGATYEDYNASFNDFPTNENERANTWEHHKDLGHGSQRVPRVSATTSGGATHNHGSTATFTKTFKPKYVNVIMGIML